MARTVNRIVRVNTQEGAQWRAVKLFQDHKRASNKLECLPDARIRWLPVDMGSLGPRRGPTEGQNLAPPSRLRSCLFAYLSWPSRLAAWGLKSAERARMPCSSWDTECERGRGDLRDRGRQRRMFRNIGSFSRFTSMCVSQISWARAVWGEHYCGTCAPVAHACKCGTHRHTPLSPSSQYG